MTIKKHITMRNLIIALVMICTSALSAQDKLVNFGIKAGLNYGDNGEIEYTDIATNILTAKGDARTGFHMGMFVRASLTDNLFLRPELQYTQTSTSYDFAGISTDYKLSKLDMPLLVGVKIIGPLYVMAGPSLQYIVNNDLDKIEVDDVKSEFTVGLQFGAGVQLGRLNADIRYERGLSDNQATKLQNSLDNFSEVRVDARANQLILSLGLDL